MKRGALILLLLAACATSKEVWRKDGASQQDFYQDDGQCKAQAFGSSPLMNQYQIVIVYTACMQGKGWYRTRVPI